MTDDANTKLYVTKMIEKLVTLGSSHTYIHYVYTHTQGWEFAHSLIRTFAHFAQIKSATESDSLRSLTTNERP